MSNAPNNSSSSAIRYDSVLAELEAELQQKGITPEQITGLKEQIYHLYLTGRHAGLTEGSSHLIMRTTSEYMAAMGAEFTVFQTAHNFAGKYHIWMSENEVMIVDSKFEAYLREICELPEEKIQTILRKVRHTISQLRDQNLTRIIYADIIRETFAEFKNSESNQDKDEYIHTSLVELFAKLTNARMAKSGQSLFRSPARIKEWLELEKSFAFTYNAMRKNRSVGEHSSDTPPEIECVTEKVLTAIRNRDITAVISTLNDPTTKKYYDASKFTNLIPKLTELLN